MLCLILTDDQFGYDTTQGGMAAREFADWEQVSGYARAAMKWTVNCSRAQIATMMYCLLE